MQVNGWHILVAVTVAFLLGWFYGPNGEGINRVLYPGEYEVVKTDTVISYIPYQEPPVIVTKLKPYAVIDTVYKEKPTIDTDYKEVDRTYLNDLVQEYECIIQKLIDVKFERIKKFQEVTAEGDSIYIELASVKDLILKAELKLAAREVPAMSYINYMTPKEQKESWYIKPAIAISSGVLGYAAGSIK